MGNAVLKGPKTPVLLDETRLFTLWTISDVRELWKRFQNQIFGFALVEAQFESIISFKEKISEEVELEELFKILDNDHDGRIDGLEFLGGLTLCCNATFEEKARFCFELFDFNLNSTLSKKELILMMMSSVCGLNALMGGGEELEPPLEDFEKFAEDAILRADTNSDGQISFDEFVFWARSNRDLMSGLDALQKIASTAKVDIQPDDPAPVADEEVLSDAEIEFETGEPTDSHKKPRKMHVESEDFHRPSRGDESTAVVQWRGQVTEPTNFKRGTHKDDGPETNLHLTWAFGYAAQGRRSNLRYVQGNSADPEAASIVYYTATLGIVYNLKTKTQSFYMGHAHEITCMSVHVSQQILATGDVKSNIHIWKVDNGATNVLSIIKGMGRHGVQHVVFSPSGDRIVSVSLDPDHTVTVYDVNSGAVISSGKGLVSPNTVYDIAYNSSGNEVCIVGKNQIKYFLGVNTNKRAMETRLGVIGNEGQKQTFFCVTYIKDEAVVGCASGEIYRFDRNGKCVQHVQAHGIKEPVLCLYFNVAENTLVSGGKDALVKTWDTTLKEIGVPIDISEDTDGDGKADNGSLDCAVISAQHVGDRVLIGTKGCDIFEAKLPANPAEHHTLTRVAWGHASGELWGLAVHPLREEFLTCGDDKTIRIWSLRTREQVHLRVMPDSARTATYNPNGEIIALGMIDGSVALMEANSAGLLVYATWKHSDRSITDIKFSPDGNFLAAGSADCNIYLYHSEDRKTFRRQAVCRGHSGAISHLDFSANSAYMMSNGNDYAALYWDVKGNQIKASTTLRDVGWDGNTCVFSWATQGIWPKGCDYTDINACQALPDIGDIVTGDDFYKVCLYKYPALETGAVHQSYIGHASHVTNVRFSANRRFVISLGGMDRSILLWKHEMERMDDSDDEGDDEENSAAKAAKKKDVHELAMLTTPKASLTELEIAAQEANEAVKAEGDLAKTAEMSKAAEDPDAVHAKHEIADVGDRSLEQEAANLGYSVEELRQYRARQAQGGNHDALEAGPGGGDESSSQYTVVRPWKSHVVEPAVWQEQFGCTDVDFTLQWVHGYRSYDCRNNVLYSASGCIVYNTASLAVVHNKGTGKQQFLQGIHLDEVIGIAVHPAQQIFATGEAGTRPSIVLWNSKDMQVINRIEGAHSRGVPLLAFNKKGNYLASVGLDSDSSLCIHDWMKGIQVLKTSTEKNSVYCMCFLGTEPPLKDWQLPKKAPTVASKGAASGAIATAGAPPPASGSVKPGAATTGGARSVASVRSVATAGGGNSSDPNSSLTPQDIVVTGGENCLKFWWSQGQNVQSQRALWGKEKKHTILSVASGHKGICVTGSSKGILLIWQDYKVVANIKTVMDRYAPKNLAAADPQNKPNMEMVPVLGNPYPHKSAIQTIHMCPGDIDVIHEDHHVVQEILSGYHGSCRYVTGDRDGVVAVWRMIWDATENTPLLILMKVFNVTQLFPKSANASVRSICERDGVLLIGTKGNEIYEVADAEFDFQVKESKKRDHLKELFDPTATQLIDQALSIDTKVGSAGSAEEEKPHEYDFSKEITEGVQRLNISHCTGEVWGLAMHPFLLCFLTTGDDSTVKCWDLASNKLISVIALPDKSRAVDIKPIDGQDFALSLNSGAVWTLKMEMMLNPLNKVQYRSSIDPSLEGYVVELISPAPLPTPPAPDAGSGDPKPPAEKKESPRPTDPKASAAAAAAPSYQELTPCPSKWNQVVRYCFNASLLAVGSHDHCIYLYDVSRGYALHCKIAGHTSFISQLDFGVILQHDKEISTSTVDEATNTVTVVTTKISQLFNPEKTLKGSAVQGMIRQTTQKSSKTTVCNTDLVVKSETEPEVTEEREVKLSDICIQSNSGKYELMFWSAEDGKRIETVSHIKDAWWASFTCPYGWPVQGIWTPGDNATEINAVARSHSWDEVPVIATVDNFGRVRLYNYPCVTPGAADKCYRGHANHVTNISFSHDDTYCVTIGGYDKCVFVWQTDIEDEKRERRAFAAMSRKEKDPPAKKEAAAEGEKDEDFCISKAVAAGGDEFSAVKPWLGTVREPSDWKEPPELGQAPDASLELKFVYGYRGWDCRNNINFADSRFEAVYHIGATGIVYNSLEHKQIFNTEHDDDILCLAVHPEGHTVATGEVGKLPKIVLWDANTGITIRVLMCHKKGVANIAFSGDGSILVSTGLDDDRTVVVHNVQTGAILGKGKAGRGIDVYSICVGGNESFVTGGKNHVKFWELPKPDSPGGELSSKVGIYNIKAVTARTVVSTSYLGADAVTGMIDGTLLLWKDRSNTKHREAHKGAITAMTSIHSTGGIDSRENGPRIVTAGKDGFIYIWDIQLTKIWTFNMSECPQPSANPQISAIATKENRLLVGTKAAEIYEVNILNPQEVFLLVQGHYDEKVEVWGLAVHPKIAHFVTCGDDKTVRLWDSRSMRQLDGFDIGTRARAVAYSADGNQVAVGTFDGKVHVLRIINGKFEDTVTSVAISNAWIQCMSYSPTGDLLAVGSHDDCVYILDTKSYSCRFKCKGHHSFISAVDFSTDNSKLQSASGDYELLFWDVNTGKQITSASLMRDVKWASFTSILGWPVQGIWPPNANGTDVNAVDRSPDGQYLVTGDDFKTVKLFRYPCPKEHSKYKGYKGHSENVMNVKFSSDGRHVFTVGGLDKAVMQFEVKMPKVHKK